jgi:hypothetical protein
MTLDKQQGQQRRFMRVQPSDGIEWWLEIVR